MKYLFQLETDYITFYAKKRMSKKFYFLISNHSEDSTEKVLIIRYMKSTCVKQVLIAGSQIKCKKTFDSVQTMQIILGHTVNRRADNEKLSEPHIRIVEISPHPGRGRGIISP